MQTKKRKKQSARLQISFQETLIDMEKYHFLLDEVKESLGISNYLKSLIDRDELYQNYHKKIAPQEK